MWKQAAAKVSEDGTNALANFYPTSALDGLVVRGGAQLFDLLDYISAFDNSAKDNMLAAGRMKEQGIKKSVRQHRPCTVLAFQLTHPSVV